MEDTVTLSVIRQPMTPVSVSDQKIATGLFQEVKAEIFSRHCRFEVQNVFRTGKITQRTVRKVCWLKVIYGRRIFAQKIELKFCVKSLANGFHDLAHPMFDHVDDLRRKRSYRAT